MVNGKQKGAAFEREICKQLSLWVSHSKQEDVFWRSAMSGGRSTVAKMKGKILNSQSGDITCIDPIGYGLASKFYMECKFHRDLNYLGIFSATGKLVSFWQTAVVEALAYSKEPMLIAKQNRFATMVCLNKAGINILGVGKRALLVAPKLDLHILPWFEFLKYATVPEVGARYAADQTAD